jgi:hypothetical protein
VASRSVGRSFPDGPPDSLIAIAPGNELPNSPLSGDPRIDMTGAAPHRLGALAGRQAHGWARLDLGIDLLDVDDGAERSLNPMMRILVRLWSGLTLPSALRRCTRP